MRSKGPPCREVSKDVADESACASGHSVPVPSAQERMVAVLMAATDIRSRTPSGIGHYSGGSGSTGPSIW